MHYNYGGNLTALFCHGVNLPIPPALEREHIYRFPNSDGYDGQAYHYVAHDPFARLGIGRLLPDANWRYRRILVPVMAYLVALGRQDWVDRSYLACNLIFLFLGSWWLAGILSTFGIHPGFAVLYLLVPATVISLDRFTVDLALTSLSLGFAVYTSSRSRWKLYAVLALAPLCRETGLVLVLATAVPDLMARRYRQSLFWASTLLPTIAWYGLVRWSFGPFTQTVPLLSALGGPLHPFPYQFPAAVTAALHLFDGVLLFGEWVAIALGFRKRKEAAVDPVRAAIVLWAMGGIPISVWTEFYSSSRVLSSLLMFEFLRSFPERRRIYRLPLLMVSPRIWIQLLPQIGGVLRGILAG